MIEVLKGVYDLYQTFERTNVTNIDIQTITYPLQDIQTHMVTGKEFPIGGLADPGKPYDVLPRIPALFKEPPETKVTDHAVAPYKYSVCASMR